MLKWIYSIFFIFLFQWSHAQTNIDFRKYFSEDALKKVSPIKFLKNYSLIEQDFYMMTNLVRLYPKEFEKLLVDYVKASSEYQHSNPYVLSLRRDLTKLTPNTEVLVQHQVLDAQAKKHAEYAVRTKQVGHQNIQQRVQVVRQKMKHNTYAENCAYNYDTALDLLMALLIDDGIRGVGHRKNILNKNLTHIGISVLPYRYAGPYCTVQIFSAK